MAAQNLGAQQRREWKRAIKESILKANTEKAADPGRVEPAPTQPQSK
jgi:hypothetical protein